MPKRSITDEEIGLIKAMLARGMLNRDIQFHFNRPDRPVNSGRITGIKQGRYGADAPAAAASALDAFLDERRRGLPLADRVRRHFERRGDGQWHLIGGETAELECKESFEPKQLNPIIKTVAALANCRGGFIFIGVADADGRVVGLRDAAFQDTDIAQLSDKIKEFLEPTPVFSKHDVSLGDKTIGVIQVEEHAMPPVVVCRDGGGLEAGTILFRYPGQSAPVRPADLQAMLQKRDRLAQDRFLSMARRLSEIGTDKALIVDQGEGVLHMGDNTIPLDSGLVDYLGSVRADEAGQRAGTLVPREGWVLTPDMVVKAYLQREPVRSPLQYVFVSALTPRHWLPLRYFVRLHGRGAGAVIEELERFQASYPRSKQRALERLRGERSVYAKPSAKALPVNEEIRSGQIGGIDKRHLPILIAQAVQGLPDDFGDLSPLLSLLSGMHDASRENAMLRGAVYRAASRLDEIETALA